MLGVQVSPTEINHLRAPMGGFSGFAISACPATSQVLLPAKALGDAETPDT